MDYFLFCFGLYSFLIDVPIFGSLDLIEETGKGYQ